MQNSKAKPLKSKSDVSLLWAKRWIRCAGALLLLVAFSKWISIWEGTEVLAAVDPLTRIRYGTLLTVALFSNFAWRMRRLNFLWVGGRCMALAGWGAVLPAIVWRDYTAILKHPANASDTFWNGGRGQRIGKSFWRG